MGVAHPYQQNYLRTFKKTLGLFTFFIKLMISMNSNNVKISHSVLSSYQERQLNNCDLHSFIHNFDLMKTQDQNEYVFPSKLIQTRFGHI